MRAGRSLLGVLASSAITTFHRGCGGLRPYTQPTLGFALFIFALLGTVATGMKAVVIGLSTR
ncbi:MAG TPA: hypothetical protein VNP04_24510 [Alphaproteobacteria bacterium]|nr:hypothetical protein [Alphaproteobacteria bacterium]